MGLTTFYKNIMANLGLRSQFSQGVLWNLGSIVILSIGGILINLIIVSMRGEDALGVFNQVYAVFMLSSQIGVGGIHFSVLKQISYHNEDYARCGDITSSAMILAMIFLFVMVLVLAWLATPIGTFVDSDAVRQGIIFVLPGVFFIGLNRILNNVINGLARMRTYAVSQSARFILMPILVLLLSLSSLPAPYLLLSFSITEAILFVVLLVYVYRVLVPLNWIRQPRHEFAEHLSYASRGIMSGVLGSLNTRIDVLMLGWFASDKLVGIYSLAATLTEGFNRIAVAIRWNVDPLIGKYFANDDHAAIQRLVQRMRRFVVPFMTILAILSTLVYPILITLFVEADTRSTSWIVYGIIIIGVAFNGHFRVFKGILLQGDKPGIYTLFISATIIINILLNLLLIPILGIYGAALATMLVYIAESLIMKVLVARSFGIRL
jgi:O-antigen/teichoic acid export membrane protein